MELVNPIDPFDFPETHRAYRYAIDIINNKITSCIYVKGACKRFIKDYENTDSTWYFDPEKSEKFLRLAQKFKHVIGKWETDEIIYADWQCFIWANVFGFRNKDTNYRRFRIAHVDVARGNAKAHYIETAVPTPKGRRRWGDIQIGDQLYDRNGNICNVIGKNEVHFPQAYKITFSDGESLICSDEHLWFTSDKTERVREKRHKSRIVKRTGLANTQYESVRTTKEIAESLVKLGETNHSIKNTMPIRGEFVKVPLDPYVLGYWLGNGHKKSNKVSCHKKDKDELEGIFRGLGYKTSVSHQKRSGNGEYIILDGIYSPLKELGVLDCKKIPDSYFTLSEQQRLDLVRGLLDSYGTINQSNDGQVSFTNKNHDIANGLFYLLCSLGYKPTRDIFKVSKNNNYKSESIFVKVSFFPRDHRRVFKLSRKYEKQQLGKNYGYTDKRFIVSCEKLEDKYPMFCVQVDSPDSSYLIGENHVPTHNSTMASQVLLYMLALDDFSQGNQISTVATKKDQARIVLDAARAMAKKSPSFLLEKGVKVLAHTIVQQETNSVARALSARDDGLDGLNDILAVMDELHAMKRETFDVIYSGMSKRKDSLTLCITTAGFDMESVGYSQHIYAKKVCTGEVVDEQMFAIVYTLDEEDVLNDKNLFNEDVWIKANPGYGVSVDPVTFKAKAEKAKTTPSDLPNFKVKHLNIWISEAKAFFDVNKWDLCADPTMQFEDFKGQKCRIGVDVASHIDLASIGYVFKKGDTYYVFDRSYIPEATLERARNDMYENCVGSGHLIKMPGEVIDQSIMEKELTRNKSEFKLEDVLLDPWNSRYLMQNLEKYRMPVTEIRMSVANLSEPTKTLDKLIRAGKIRHNGSPLLRWCLSNVVCKVDAADNVYPRKSHERLKIDPIIAILMALASWIQEEQKIKIHKVTPRFM